MRTVITALVFCTANVITSTVADVVRGSWLVVAAMFVLWWVGVVGCVRYWFSARRPPLRWVLAVALALGWWRGLAAHDAPDWSRADRLATPGLQLFSVRGASLPGARCVLEVTDQAGAKMNLEVERMDCTAAQGDEVAVVAAQLEPQEWPRDPVGALPANRVPTFRTDVAWLTHREASGYWAFVAATRATAFERAQTDPAQGLIAGTVLGLRSAVPLDVVASFRTAGLGHLLAVSGLHVALVVWMLAGFGTRLGALVGAPAHGRLIAVIVPVVAYVALTGAAAPAVRAGIMLILWGLAATFGRPAHGLTLLSVTAAGLLAIDPSWIHEVGFQLSFAAMGAVVTAPPGVSMLGLSWRICWWTAPLSLLHFGVISLASLLANVVAIPVFSLVLLPFGLLSTLLPAPLDDVVITPAVWATGVLIDWADLVAAVPIAGDGVAYLLALSLLVFVVARRWPALRDHVPSRWLAVLLLAVFAWTNQRPHPDWAEFYVVAGPRSRAVVWREPDTPQRAASACFQGAKLSPSWWARAWSDLGVDRLGPIDAPPTYAAALQQASQQRLEIDPAVSCPPRPIDEAWLKHQIRRCLRRASGFVWLAGSYDLRPPQCFVRGRWQSMDEP